VFSVFALHWNGQSNKGLLIRRAVSVEERNSALLFQNQKFAEDKVRTKSARQAAGTGEMVGTHDGYTTCTHATVPDLLNT
jgi:hypothetical protein